MLEAYSPLLVFLVLMPLMGVAMLSIGFALGGGSPYTQKNSPYECGFEAFEDARMHFDVRYYLVAILFIIFDLEIAFMFPWAVILSDMGTPAVLAMSIFLVVLVVGFVYEWSKGALEWE